MRRLPLDAALRMTGHLPHDNLLSLIGCIGLITVHFKTKQRQRRSNGSLPQQDTRRYQPW